MNIYYVYRLRLADSDKPFYIGKGKGRRMHQHCHPSVLRCKSIKNSIIKSARSRGVAVILNMYEMFRGGVTVTDVALKYSMSVSAVCHVKSGKSFTELHRANHSGEV